MEISNLSDAEFKRIIRMVIRMLNLLSKDISSIEKI